MEVTALCIRLLINVLVLLLPAQVQHIYSHKADATFPRIVPSRLQLFEYESIFVKCEGFFNDLTEWRVMRKIKGRDTICNSKLEVKGSCTITTAFSADSGEYWCQAEGKKSNTVNIIVTAGFVILESPALPVMEGDDVTLRCRNKTTSSNFTADFYKDGLLIRNSSTGEMTIYSVSKSEEGLYKCNISGAGESAESWLTVRACQEETPLPVSRFPRVSILLWTVVTGLLVALLLLLVLGLHYTKYKGASTSPSFPTPSPLQTRTPTMCQCAETRVAELQQATYAVVTKPWKEKDEDESLTTPAYYTLSMEPGVSSSTARPVPSESTKPLLTEEDCFYYTIN